MGGVREGLRERSSRILTSSGRRMKGEQPMMMSVRLMAGYGSNLHRPRLSVPEALTFHYKVVDNIDREKSWVEVIKDVGGVDMDPECYAIHKRPLHSEGLKTVRKHDLREKTSVLMDTFHQNQLIRGYPFVVYVVKRKMHENGNEEIPKSWKTKIVKNLSKNHGNRKQGSASGGSGSTPEGYQEDKEGRGEVPGCGNVKIMKHSDWLKNHLSTPKGYLLYKTQGIPNHSGTMDTNTQFNMGSTTHQHQLEEEEEDGWLPLSLVGSSQNIIENWTAYQHLLRKQKEAKITEDSENTLELSKADVVSRINHRLSSKYCNSTLLKGKVEVKGIKDKQNSTTWSRMIGDAPFAMAIMQELFHC